MALGNTVNKSTIDKKKSLDKKCVCGSQLLSSACCLPIIEGETSASAPEQLMRSRYSAYVLHKYSYIHDTYSQFHQDIPSMSDIAESALDTHWIKLTILASKILDNGQGQVEFRAIYAVNKHPYQLHECSDFIIEQGQWRYAGGNILDDSGEITQPLNGPCICGNAKKLKRCCLRY